MPSAHDDGVRARRADDRELHGRAVVLGGASTVGGVGLGYKFGISGMWLVVAIGAGSALFSGVFFPTQLLQTYAGPKLGSISLILPATHGLQGIRQVLIEGHGLAQVTQPLFTLLGFLVVLLPFSRWVFGRAVRRGIGNLDSNRAFARNGRHPYRWHSHGNGEVVRQRASR